MGEISMIGLDIAKNVFQVHGIDAEEIDTRDKGRGIPGPRLILRSIWHAHHFQRTVSAIANHHLQANVYVHDRRNRAEGNGSMWRVSSIAKADGSEIHSWWRCRLLPAIEFMT